MLKVVPLLKAEGVDAVICGGWVPFLKELARNCRSDHTMSLDIDVLLRARAENANPIDRLKYLVFPTCIYNFERSSSTSFRYEKSVDGNLVELDLLADLPRARKDDLCSGFTGQRLHWICAL